MADNKIMRNTLVLVRRSNSSIKSLTGQRKNPMEDKISLLVPLKSLMDLMEFEDKLKNDDFSTACVSFIISLKFL